MGNKKSGAVFQLSGMMIITLITQFLSIYKSSIIAANFGVCVEMDAYHFANNLSTFFLTFIGTGVTTVIIPSYVKKLDKKATDTFISVIFTVVICLLVGLYIGRETVVHLLTAREEAFNNYVISLMSLTMIIQLLPAMLSVTTAFYQCSNHYVIPKAILLCSNIGMLIVLVCWDSFSIYEYLYVLLGGAVFQTIVDIAVALKLGFRFRISFDIRNPEFLSLVHVFVPTLFSTGVYKINTMVDSLLSSNLGTGQITILSYAHTIVGMVNTLVIGNLTVYVYPKIVKSITKGKEIGQKCLWSYAAVFHCLLCLLIAGFFAVGREFIGLLYERGQFDSNAANSVYFCMCIYIFGQQNNIVRDLVYRYFYSHKNTKSTFKNGLMTSVINISLSFLMVRFWGVYGIAIATVIAGVCSLCVITLRLKKQYGIVIEWKPIAREFAVNEFCMILSIVAIKLLKTILVIDNYILAFIVFGVISVAVFGAALLICRSRLLQLAKAIQE